MLLHDMLTNQVIPGNDQNTLSANQKTDESKRTKLTVWERERAVESLWGACVSYSVKLCTIIMQWTLFKFLKFRLKARFMGKMAAFL